MPIYEYKCDNEHVFDIMQRMSDDPLTECVECGAPVRKVLHPVGISFKGSGFYSTDYSGKTKGSEKAPDTPAKNDSPDSPSSKNGGSKNGESSTTSKKSDSTTSSSSSSSSSKKE